MHEGRLTRARAPGVGAEPLLLPDAHPDQGRADRRQVRGPGVPPRVDPAHPRPRRRRQTARAGSRSGCGWPRRWASIAGGGRAAARVLPGVRFACDAYVELVRDATAGRGGGLVADRVLRARPDVERIAAWEQHYPWVGRRGAGLFRDARPARAPRLARRRSAFVVARRATHARAAGRAAWRRWSARPRSCGTCSTACRPRARAGARRPGDRDRRDARPPARLAARRACASIARRQRICCSIPSAASCSTRPAPTIVAPVHRRARRWREIVDALAARYGAPRDAVERDVLPLSRALAERDAARDWCRGPRDRRRRALHAGRGAHLPLSAALRLLLEPGRARAAGARARHRDWLRVLRRGRGAGRGAGEPHRRRAAAARRPRGARRGGARARASTRNLITSGVPLTRERLARAARARPRHRPALVAGRRRREPPTRIAGRDVVRRTSSRSARWVQGARPAAHAQRGAAPRATSTASPRSSRSPSGSGPTGWSSPTRSTSAGRSRNRDALLPDARRSSSARARAAARARDRLRGRMEVLFVLPDYHAGIPRACMDGWGAALHRGHARRPRAALPRGAHASPGLTFENVRDAVARRDLARLARASTPFAARRWMPEPCRTCERRDASTSAAAAARRLR